jgi:hypothetical protein
MRGVVLVQKLRWAEVGHLRGEWVERAESVRRRDIRNRHKVVLNLANGLLNLVAMTEEVI